ncbi:hypothetical protein E7811_17585 [Aliigemmobacter aestuarii]|uniref:Uncharacterized protein n=1 Tax=Aliigemmobacter aestuarii TaxID=1445661 RepID=A0A4S3MJ29_9RHOB|nr:hypothetical protein [Gemmobacter aestuarii]THD80839.1 hypothetical protein E7811_17585 [Gemmobacter aestuarii]
MIDLSDCFEPLFDPRRFVPAELGPYAELTAGIRLGCSADDVSILSLTALPVTESRQILRFAIQRKRRMLWLTLECRIDPALLMRTRRIDLCVIGEGERTTSLGLQLIYYSGAGERTDLLPTTRPIPVVQGKATTRVELPLDEMVQLEPTPGSRAEIALFLDPAMPEFDLGGIFMSLHGQ